MHQRCLVTGSPLIFTPRWEHWGALNWQADYEVLLKNKLFKAKSSINSLLEHFTPSQNDVIEPISHWPLKHTKRSRDAHKAKVKRLPVSTIC